MNTSLSTETAHYKATIGSGEKSEVKYLTQVEGLGIVQASNRGSKKIYLSSLDKFFDIRDIKLEPLDQATKDRLAMGNIYYYNWDKLIGKYKKTDRGAYQVDRYREVKRKASDGGNEKQIVDTWHETWVEGVKTKIKKEDVIFY